MSCPPDIFEKLQMQREALKQGENHQKWLARWWDGLLTNDKRTLLAFADLDDSTDNARRPWLQYSQEKRDKLIHECQRLHKLVECVKWA